MTDLEQHDTALAAKSSWSQLPLTATALSLALMAAQYANPVEAPQGAGILEVDGSNQTVVSVRDVSTQDLVGALSALLDELLGTQIDLDADTERILYENLWDLYE